MYVYCIMKNTSACKIYAFIMYLYVYCIMESICKFGKLLAQIYLFFAKVHTDVFYYIYGTLNFTILCLVYDLRQQLMFGCGVQNKASHMF